tara:strand:- start:1218 stop:1433 length:216 start_codon:yes stop_codon:yes gene_type:complete
MKLVKNWKSILLKAHSMWAVYLGIVVILAPELLFLTLGYDVVSPYTSWVVGFILLVYGGFGRIIDQGVSDD